MNVFNEYENLGMIEEVLPNDINDDGIVLYLLHRAVFKDHSQTTKCRPVFNASLPGYNNISLNDCLLTGPPLQADLCEILLRFRRYQIAISADISKAFLQIGIKEPDRDVLRFLLPSEEGDVRHMRFTRVPFGVTSSPFLLNATIQYHLNKYDETPVISSLKEDMFVDNWVTGGDTVEEVTTKYKEGESVMKDANFTLSQWESNDKNISALFNDAMDEGENRSNVLGLLWKRNDDTFSFKCCTTEWEKLELTKRSVLSLISKVFDPIGQICPVTMYAKILFQELWRKGFNWDEVLPCEIQNQFKKWLMSNQKLSKFEMQRCFFPGTKWNELKNVELIVFCDASLKGYGSCVYIRHQLDETTFDVAFVAARSRVAPMKIVTLPRLELLACLLGARLLYFILTALHLENIVRCYCYTDSTVALGWINSEPAQLKVFNANRVKEIQKLTDKESWNHVEGCENPADLITRGMLAEKLLENPIWLKGPQWLSQKELPVSKISPNVSELDAVQNDLAVMSVIQNDTVIDFEKYIYKMTMLLKIIAWILRFIKNCRSDSKDKSQLSINELQNAKMMAIKMVQKKEYASEIDELVKGEKVKRNSKIYKLDPFIDENGIIRVKGRLENSHLSFETKHPMIIPKGSFAKMLIVFQHDFLKHAGVDTLVSTLREEYWIVSCRRIAKTVCKECTICKVIDSRPCNEDASPLPDLRVTPSFPFSVTGLDFCGPIFCADYPSKKFYILLFTCAVVRSIHLELTESLSLKDCMLAIRKFVSRRGLPAIFISDNAKTFIAASKELTQIYGCNAPEWRFIASRSPWWGGFWERCVRTVKSSLKKTLGLKSVCKVDLETILCEIEYCVNSRPLTYIGEDTDACKIITPSHFLIGRSCTFKPSSDIDPSDVIPSDLDERLFIRSQMLYKFWKLWSESYITNLPFIVQGFSKNCKLRVGSVVLIRDENLPRLKWPLGVITKVIPSMR